MRLRLLLVMSVLASACVEGEGSVEYGTMTGALTLPGNVRVDSEERDADGDVIFTDLVTLDPFTAGPLQPRSLYARFVVARPVASGTDVKHMAEGRIQCFAGDGTSHSYVSTTENIWIEGSEITMVARMMFAPAVAGSYVCKSRVRVGKCASGETEPCSERYLVFVGGAGNTELLYTSPTWGVGWGTDNDAKHPEIDFMDEEGNRHVHPAATHIHVGIERPLLTGGAPGNQEYVARSASFVIPAGPSTFNAYSGIHMTSCFHGDPGCIDDSDDDNDPENPPGTLAGARWLGGSASTTNSVVDLYIVATQLYADGSPCVQHVGPARRITMLGDTHHRKEHVVFNDIAINRCGTTPSRRFVVKTYVERLSGNPIRVERGRVRSGNRFDGYTHTGVYTF